MTSPSISPKRNQGMTGNSDELRVELIKGISRSEISAIIVAHGSALYSGEDVLKDGLRNVVTRIRHGNTWFCVKEYRSIGLRDWIKDLLRGSRARRAWRGARHLQSHGISAPELVSLVERGRKSYLVTRFINGATPLNLLLHKRFSEPLGKAEIAAKRAMLRQLGQWLRSIHDLDIYHDDWSSKNILATQHISQWAFHVLDMESVLPRKRLTYRRRVKNLGQLSDVPFGITRTDRMRFLLAYADSDTALKRGNFPLDVISAERRRAKKWAKVQAKAFKRKAKLRRKMEQPK